MLTRTPDLGVDSLVLDGKSYQAFFANGQAQVDYVLGEFYWRVQAGEEVATDDYVRPGWMLSREANESEVSWTLSELIDPKVMESAFGVQPPYDPWPPLPHQPSPWRRPLKIGGIIAAAVAAVMLVMAMVLDGGATLLQVNAPYTLAGVERSTTFGPITLTQPYQLVSIHAQAYFNNAWVDLDYSMVNRETHTSYDAYGLAERYSGSDSDGMWAEGNGDSSVSIAAVPAGTYDLVVNTTGNRWSDGSQYSTYNSPAEGTLILTVTQGTVFPSNLLLALLLIFAPIGYFLYRHIKFEAARLHESDIVSVWQLDDEDDEDEQEVHTGFRSALEED
jgi:hypothetical protein